MLLLRVCFLNYLGLFIAATQEVKLQLHDGPVTFTISDLQRLSELVGGLEAPLPLT